MRRHAGICSRRACCRPRSRKRAPVPATLRALPASASTTMHTAPSEMSPCGRRHACTHLTRRTWVRDARAHCDARVQLVVRHEHEPGGHLARGALCAGTSLRRETGAASTSDSGYQPLHGARSIVELGHHHASPVVFDDGLVSLACRVAQRALGRSQTSASTASRVGPRCALRVDRRCGFGAVAVASRYQYVPLVALPLPSMRTTAYCPRMRTTSPSWSTPPGMSRASRTKSHVAAAVKASAGANTCRTCRSWG